MHQDTDNTAASEKALALKILLVVAVVLAAWGASIFFWGVPGLYMPAVAAVPVLYFLLVLISRG